MRPEAYCLYIRLSSLFTFMRAPYSHCCFQLRGLRDGRSALHNAVGKRVDIFNLDIDVVAVGKGDLRNNVLALGSSDPKLSNRRRPYGTRQR